MDLNEGRSLVPAPRANLTWSPHPLLPAQDREVVFAELLPRETLGEYLRRTGIAAKLARRPAVLSINGVRVPRALWETCRPKPGTLINVSAIVRDGKNPLATIAIIALLYFSSGTTGWGAAAAEGFGGTQAAWTFGINVVGAMAINRLFPPTQPNLSGAQGASASPTYALTGGSNRARPFQPMPVIMGTHKVFPDYGSQSYTEFQGEDQFLYQIFDFGYNDVVLSNFAIGATPIENFQGVTLQESDATGVLTLFPGDVGTVAGAVLVDGAGYTSRTTDLNTTQIAIDVAGSVYFIYRGELKGMAALLNVEYRAVGAGSWIPVTFDSDAVPVYLYGPIDTDTGYASIVGISYMDANLVPGGTRADGGAFVAGDVQIGFGNRDSGSPALVRRTYNWAVPKGQYEVQVKVSLLHWIGADPNGQVVSDLAWSQMRSYKVDSADYTGRKRVALKIKASGQLNGAVAQLSAIGRARTQVWSGAAWVNGQETSNPAWWYLAVARGVAAGGRRVWGAGLADARIDLEGLKVWGAYCTANGLTFDGVFDQPKSVYDMLAAVASQGRATVSWPGGKLGVVVDAAAQPVVAVFGMSNIIAGSFEISYATAQLADEIECQFINPDLDWQSDSVRALVPGTVTPVRTTTIQLFGCTSKDLAGRAANLYAATNAYRLRHYTWKSDFEGMVASRGDVVQLSHDLASLDYSGRFVEGGSASTLKLPGQVPLYAGGAFVVIVKPDGTFATYAVVAGAGMSDMLTLVTPLGFNPWADADHPPYDYKWLYGATATPGKKVKIDSVRPLDARTVEIAAVDELDAFYAAESGTFTYVAPSVIFGGVPQVSNLKLTSEGVRAGAGYVVRVIATWDSAGNYSFADVRVGVNGAAPTLLQQNVRGRQIDFTISDNQAVIVEVIAYGSLGRMGNSVKLAVAQTINFAALSPPPDVASFSVAGDTFTWPAAPNVDNLGAFIRFNYGNSLDWAVATPLHEGLITDSPKSFPALPAGLVSIGIKYRDAAQLESVLPAWIVKNLGDSPVANVVTTFDLKALGWPGTVTGGAVDGSGNLAATNTTAADPADPNASAWSALGTDPADPASSYLALVYESTFIAATGSAIGSALTLPYTVQGNPFFLEYRQDNSDPAFPIDTSLPAYLADTSQPAYGPPPDYATWPGSVVYDGLQLQFRVTCAGGPTQGVISQLTPTIDVPDESESLQNVVITAPSTRLPIAKLYEFIKTVQLTVFADGGTAVNARAIDYDPTLGPLVECLNAAGTAVNGHLGADIQGARKTT